MNIKKIVGVAGIVISSALLPVTAEVIPGTTYNVNFESGHIVGSGRHLNMSQIPVTDIDTGITAYYDMSFRFTYNPSDGIIFQQVSSATVSPPLLSATNLVPGVYQGNGGHCYILENPIALTSSHALYVFQAFNGTGCSTTRDFSSQITSGLSVNNPEYGYREIVPNLKQTYVYGVIAKGGYYGSDDISDSFDQHELIGLRQVGNQLIVGLFSEGLNVDGTPTDFVEPRVTAILNKI